MYNISKRNYKKFENFKSNFITKVPLDYRLKLRGRGAGHTKDVGFLTSLPGASEKLQIFNADLSIPESFSPAIEGCIGVFHVATPVDFGDEEPEEIVTKRSIDGALGILNACLSSQTVKRVVYTSSAAAVLYRSDHDVDDEVDESVWSDVDFIKAINLFGGSYAISKTLTERAVLEFGEKHGLELDLVTIIPSLVIGPFICPKLPSSVSHALAMVLGMYFFCRFKTPIEDNKIQEEVHHTLKSLDLYRIVVLQFHQNDLISNSYLCR